MKTFYLITCDNERYNLEESFKTLEAARDVWNHTNSFDKKHMPNAKIEKVTIDDNDVDFTEAVEYLK